MKSVDISLWKKIFPNINDDGWKFVSIMSLISIFLSLMWLPIGIISFFITIFTYYCFRDPVRITPVLTNAVISPADGFVISITKEKGPEELGMSKKKYTRVCIYMSVIDAQICRIPIRGKVSKFFQIEGKNITKNFEKDDIRNERFLFVLKHDSVTDFALCLTSIFCNKRIVNRKIEKNAEFLAGQQFGFIRFGGYVDLYIPDKIEPQVCVGQKMIAGETIIADIHSDAPRITGEIR